MQIILYRNSSPNNYVTKELSNELILNGSLRNESSIINPVFTIQHDNPVNYNYIYIPEFKRFYYIDNIESLRLDYWRLSCHVDVLNTYRSEILSHQAIIDKQESISKSQMYLDDGDFVVQNKKYISTYNFPSGLIENGEFILITAGA